MANAATGKSSSARSRQGAAASTARARASERDSDARELTGERDEHYNLISILYHGLQGADQCAIYAEDADEAGDDEVAELMRSAGRAQADLARRAKQLLLTRLSASGGKRGRSAEDEGDDDDDELEDDDEE